MTPFIAEIIGTALLLTLGCGVVANVVLNETKGNNRGWIVITTGWALAVFIGVVVAGPYSGAHLNPAVTVALAVAGKFAMIGAFVIWLTHKDHFDVTEDPDSKLAVYSTGPAIRNVFTNFMCELVGTFVLVFVIFYFAGANLEDGKGTLVGLGSVGAIPVAFLVWAIGLSLGGTTGYAINPARDLGPRIMHSLLPVKTKKSKGDWGYAWIPVVAPIIGGVLAAFLYMSLS